MEMYGNHALEEEQMNMSEYVGSLNKPLSRKVIILNREAQLRSKKGYCLLRRMQDIILSIFALVVLSPFLLLTALIIWLDDSKRSPIFVQDRVGRDGKIFRFYKFRSMYVGAEEKLESLLKDNEMDGPAFKMKNEPNLNNPDEVVQFIIEFYQKNNIKSERELIRKLSKETPLRKLIEKQKVRTR